MPQADAHEPPHVETADIAEDDEFEAALNLAEDAFHLISSGRSSCERQKPCASVTQDVVGRDECRRF